LPAPELRLVLAVSLDGRLAPPSGGAAQLGGRGDRRVLEEALAWADAALVGANTLRLHGTTCLIRQPDLLEQRRSQARPPQPTAVVVSRSGRFDGQLRFFSQPLTRWLLGPSLSEAPEGFETVVPLPSWGDAMADLAARGQKRLVVLGGAALAGALLQEQLVDELQLTVCPQVLGGPHSWLPPGVALEPCQWQLLEQRRLEDEELLLRYRRLRG
jgi:5-amino-6-(5-phosphoribosylamino)uracil reductase